MAIFQNVERWISKDKEGREALSDQLLEVASQDVRKEEETVRSEVSHTIEKALSSQDWKVKAARNASISDPWHIGRTVSPFGAVVATGIMIATCQPMDFIVTGLIVSGMMFIAGNPFNIVSRYLSRQTRALLFITILFDMCSYFSGYKPVMLASVLYSAVVLVICYYMNNRWLMEYNWLHSEAVIHSLCKAPDNKGVKHWEDVGKRQTRTVLSQLGLPSDDDVLQIFAKHIYIVGFYGAFFSTADDIEAKEKAEAEVKKKETELLIDAKKIADLEKELEEAIRQSKEASDKYLAEASARREAEKKAEELQARIERAEKLNDPKADIRDMIRVLRSETDEKGNPMSYPKITSILHAKGFTESQSTIARIGKEIEKEAS